MSRQRICQELHYWPLLQSQCLHHREDPLHETTAPCTMTTKRILTPQHTGSQLPLDMIVRRLHPLVGVADELPHRRLELQQIPAKRRRPGVAAKRTFLQPTAHVEAQYF